MPAWEKDLEEMDTNTVDLDVFISFFKLQRKSPLPARQKWKNFPDLVQVMKRHERGAEK